MICKAEEDGKPLSADILQQYKLARGKRSDLTALNLPEPIITGPGIKKFRFGSMAGEVFSAMGRFLSAQKTEKQEAVNRGGTAPSVQIAKAKRRPRLFGNVGVGDVQEQAPAATPLGTMEDFAKRSDNE
jgi:hypothetical protein